MSTVDSVMRMRAAVRTGFSSTVYAHRVVAFPTITGLTKPCLHVSGLLLYVETQ